MRDRIKRFVKNLAEVLLEGIFEDPEILDVALLTLAALGALYLLGVALHAFVVDPHSVTSASLDALSINPDKWMSG
jgi:hypothetical protein